MIPCNFALIGEQKHNGGCCMLNTMSSTCLCCFETSDIVSFVGMLIGVINVYFVCKTFCHQRKTYKEVQFKNTYYQKQNYHRKLTDSLKVNADLLSQDLVCCRVTYIARQCFLFSERECRKINSVLSHEKYLGTLEDKDFQAAEYWHTENNSDKEKWAIYNCWLKYYTVYYKISEKIYNQAKSCPDKTEFVFRVFLNKWLICYEHYTRSLLQILMYIENEIPKSLSKEKYINEVVFQMAKEELCFIKQYSAIHDTFCQYYVESGLSDKVDEQLSRNTNIL